MTFLDLEDAVSPLEKEAARPKVVEAIRSFDWGDRVLCVRVNAWDTEWTAYDVIEVVSEAGERLDEIMLPKVQSAAEVVAMDLLLTQVEKNAGLPVGHIGIEAQIETARGLINVEEICAASPRLETIILGPVDMSASMEMPSLAGGLQIPEYPGDYFHYVFVKILMAGRANGLQVIDGPYVKVRDSEGFRDFCRRTQILGYDGKWALHPDQVTILNEVFSPTPGAVRQGVGRPRRLREGHDRRRAQGRGHVRRRDDRRGVPQGRRQARQEGRTQRYDALEGVRPFVVVIDCIIPARDEERTVADNVAAALGCRYVREVIVVDDGSTDGTADVARAAGAKVIVRDDSDGSKAHAMDDGVAASDAEAILFVDADCTGLTSAPSRRDLQAVRRRTARSCRSARSTTDASGTRWCCGGRRSPVNASCRDGCGRRSRRRSSTATRSRCGSTRSWPNAGCPRSPARCAV